MKIQKKIRGGGVGSAVGEFGGSGWEVRVDVNEEVNFLCQRIEFFVRGLGFRVDVNGGRVRGSGWM